MQVNLHLKFTIIYYHYIIFFQYTHIIHIYTLNIFANSLFIICELAKVNRTTFYANYKDLSDLIENIRIRMLKETASLFEENSSGHSPEIFLKLLN